MGNVCVGVCTLYNVCMLECESSMCNVCVGVCAMCVCGQWHQCFMLVLTNNFPRVVSFIEQLIYGAQNKTSGNIL